MRFGTLGRVLVAHGQLAFVVERRVVHDDHERHHKGSAKEDGTDLPGQDYDVVSCRRQAKDLECRVYQMEPR